MAGAHHEVISFDPALVKYADVSVNRYKYFRWTPRATWVNLAVVVAVPGVLGLIAYTTDGKFELRGKRKGDSIREF